MNLKSNQPCFCSWSGGKDSCLALYKAMQRGYCPKFLFTTCIETGGRSHVHYLSTEVLKAQAKSIGLPLVCCETTWSAYRVGFVEKINQAKNNVANIVAGVFGDIDIEGHKEWVYKVCSELDCEPLLPLWKRDRKSIVKEFLELGFKAQIVVVDSQKLGPEYLGRILDMELFDDFVSKKIDPCGENGEFHTLVVDGPIFVSPLETKKIGDPVLESGYWIQPILNI